MSTAEASKHDVTLRKRRSWFSPISSLASRTTAGGYAGMSLEACFPVLMGTTEVLARDSIRGDLQARLAVARVTEQPPASTPTSLLDGTEVVAKRIWVVSE
jgi:hypothetical protein